MMSVFYDSSFIFRNILINLMFNCAPNEFTQMPCFLRRVVKFAAIDIVKKLMNFINFQLIALEPVRKTRIFYICSKKGRLKLDFLCFCVLKYRNAKENYKLYVELAMCDFFSATSFLLLFA